MAPHAEPTIGTANVNATATPSNGTINLQTTSLPSSTNTAPSAPPSTYKSISHLKSYPIVADSINTFTSTPLGQRTISLSTTAYSRFIAPLSPYLSKAYPYVSAADSFADSNLGKIESAFPIVKEPTEQLKSRVIDTVGYPRKVVAEVIVRGQDYAREGQEYVFRVFEDEVSREGGPDGVVKRAKAGVTTGLVVSSELMGAIASYLGNKKEEVKQTPAAENATSKFEQTVKN
jgi:hypothetical protein